MDNMAHKYQQVQAEPARIVLAFDWIVGLVSQYAAILLGLAAGTAAKYRLDRGEGRRVSLRDVMWDLLLLPSLALICVYASKVTGAGPDLQAVIAVLLAVSSDRVIRVMRKNFLNRVDNEIKDQAAEMIGEVSQMVQVERSGAAIIKDTIDGSAPDTYAALKRRGRAKRTDD